MPQLITAEQTDAPLVYTLKLSESFILLSASAVYDGRALNADFVPTFEVVGPSGWTMFYFGTDLIVTQHGTPLVTFAPQLSPATPGVASSASLLQTGLPQLEFLPGYKLAFFGRTAGQSGADPAVAVSELTLYVEHTSTGAGGNVAPLPRLVPTSQAA